VTARPTVLYIAGAGRSGSTLVELLLSRLDAACATGELRHVFGVGYRRNQLCACGREFHSCPFWREVTTIAFGPADPPAVDGLEAAMQREVRRRRLPSLLRRRKSETALAPALEQLYGAVAIASGGAVVVDSSKSPLYALYLAQVAGLDVRMLHVVRDSRGVAHSWQRRKEWRGNPGDPDAVMRTHPVRSSAQRWVEANLLAAAASRRVAASARVRYEDLCRDPDVLCDALIEIGLPRLADDLRGCSPDAAPRSHSVMGNPIRFEREKVVIKPDVDWQGEMSPRDRRLVTMLTWPMLRRYGYPLRAVPAVQRRA
jgi:hypothetical protein